MDHSHLSALISTEFLHGKYFLFGRKVVMCPRLTLSASRNKSDQVRGGSRKRAIRGHEGGGVTIACKALSNLNPPFLSE